MLANEDDDGVSSFVAVTEFDGLPREAAEELLHSCCASSKWVHQVLLGRPYGSLRWLLVACDDVLADLRWSDLAEALAGHPRTGRAAVGEPGSELIEASLAYEERFGHVFVIAAGRRSAAELLAALRTRLQNTTEVERDVVRGELAALVRLRLIATLR